MALALPESSPRPAVHMLFAAAGTSFAGLLGRLIVSMGVVLAVMWLVAKFVRGRNIGGMRKAGSNASIEVLARQSFGKNSSVAIVRAGGKALVIGVTDSQVTLLAEADAK